MLRTNQKFVKKYLLLSIIILAMAVSGCGKQNAQPQPTPVETQPTALPSPTPSASRVVLVASADTDPVIVNDAETVLRELAASSGLEFEKREQVNADEITPDIKILVYLSLPANLGSLATGAPGTQFVAITDQDWNPGPNVTIIRTREDHTAFMSGYLAALLAPNFRAGALLTAENIPVNQAFVNGVNHYCGTCTSLLYPLSAYPVISTQPAASPASAWQAGYDSISAYKINVLYVTKEAASPELMAYLAAQDLAMIGSQSPPAEGKPKWVATIYTDGISPIAEIWQDLLDGNGGKVINAGIKIADNQYVTVNDGLVWLSQGKLEFAQITMDLLQDNLINPQPVN
jgi:hypothetical protein